MMTLGSDRAIASVYAALLGETGWQDVVDEIAAVTHSDVATLFYHDAVRAHGAITLARGVSDNDRRDYADYFAPLNPWMSRVASTPVGEGIVGEQIVSRDTFRRSEYYNDFLQRQDQESGVGVTIRRDNGCFFLFSLLSGDTDMERNMGRARYLTGIAPHLRRVSEFYRRQPAGGGLALGAGEAGGISVVVVNAAARVIYASPSGEARLAAGRCLGVDAAGAVSFRDPAAQLAFRNALQRPDGSVASSLFADSVEITFVRVERDHGSTIFLGGALAVLMVDPPRQATPDMGRLALEYGLTPAERRVFAAVLAGRRISDIAEAGDVSRETVRSQLKAIFGKTGTSGQAELIRLATGLMDTTEDAGHATSQDRT